MVASFASALEALLGWIANRQDDVFLPMQGTVLYSDNGTVFVPHAFEHGRSVELPLSRGVAVSWAPCPEVDGALFILAAGNLAQPSDEAIAITLSRDGVRALARSLQLIDAQMEAAD